VAMVEGRVHGGLHRSPQQDDGGDDDDGEISASLPFPSTVPLIIFVFLVFILSALADLSSHKFLTCTLS